MEKSQCELCLEILNSLINKGESSIIKQVFNSIPKKWQGRIIKGLQTAKEAEILNLNPA